jgi:hypothetical protein
MPSSGTHAAAGGSTSLGRRVNIDTMVALCMAVERAEFRPEPAELLGWL